MGPHRSAHRVSGHGPHPRPSSNKFCNNCPWAAPIPSPAQPIGPRRNWFPSTRRCSVCTEAPREYLWPFLANHGPAHRLRTFQRYPAGEHRGYGRRQSAVFADLPNSPPAPTATTMRCRLPWRSSSRAACNSRRTIHGATASTRSPTADSSPSRLEASCRRFPAISSATGGPAITTSGTMSLPATHISFPSACAERLAGDAPRVAGIRIGVLAQRPSILGVEHALLRQWKRHRQRQLSSVRQRDLGSPAAAATALLG